MRESSPGIRRYFCGDCGTPMAYQGSDRSDEIDLYAATLDDPSSYTPESHVHWNEHLEWVKLADGLPVRRTPRRLSPDEEMAPLLALLRAAFAYMDGVIDPPSSVHRLTVGEIGRQAAAGEVWVLEDLGKPIASIFLKPEPDRLYLGKIAVAEGFRRQGLGRQLVRLAEKRARALGLERLILQSRIELSANHEAFGRLGFVRTGETAHEGYDRATSFTFTKHLP